MASVPTIADVARQAGVSPATVSRYLVGKPVRTERAIARAIEELRFRPNHVARSLKSGRTAHLALVVPDVTNPFFAAVVKGAESISRQAGYTMGLYNTDESRELEAQIVLDLPGRVDGVILAPAAEDTAGHKQLAEAGVPVVFLDREVLPVGQCDTVVVDNLGGARDAADHLVGLGHRRIGLISGPEESTPGRERTQGFVAALESWNVPPAGVHVVCGGFHEDGGYQAMLRLLALPEPPTAVFATNNLMTFGALRALRDMAIAVPAQLSIIGFDDHPLAPLLSPALTVVHRPMEEQGVLAMRLLLQRLRGTQPGEASRIVLATRLVVRGSTGTPAASSRQPVNAGNRRSP